MRGFDKLILASGCLGVAVACGGSPSRPTPPPPVPVLGAPAASSPADNADLDTVRPLLRVTNVTSTQSGQRLYEFQVADDAAFMPAPAPAAVIVVTATAVPEDTSGTTSFQVMQDLKPGTRYYWRARAHQGSVTSPWSATSRFVTMGVTNTPPVITALTLSSPRAEVGATVTLAATVTDAETPVGQLTFQWSAPDGTFAGTGPMVTWQAPTGKTTPARYPLTLTVVEKYLFVDPDGRPEEREHRVSRTATVDVNDSIKEITSLVLTFLADFSDSNVSPETCVRNFSDNCRGKAEEIKDIADNRATRTITSSSYNVRSVALDSTRTAADIIAPCEFTSILKATGKTERAVGTCVLTAVYEGTTWFLCDSLFKGSSTSGLRFWGSH